MGTTINRRGDADFACAIRRPGRVVPKDEFPMSALGECAVYDRTPPGEILSRARGADVLLTNKTPLDAGTLRALPGLRYIGVLATGYNVVN